MSLKNCHQCGSSVTVLSKICPSCGHDFKQDKLFHHKKSIVKSQSYIHDSYRPPSSFWQNVKLITRMVLKKRGPIYEPDQSVVTEKLSATRLVKHNKYIYLALFVALIAIVIQYALFTPFSVLSVTLILAILPALGYFYWLKRNERIEPEPFWMLALAFGWGVFATLIAGLINSLVFAPVFCPGGLGSSGCWVGFAGFVEEPSKILGVFLIARSKKFSEQFDDHLDGLIIGAIAGLGFGFGENIGYILGNGTIMAMELQVMVPIGLFRAMVMINHVFWTGLIGWWIGYLKMSGVKITWKSIFPALAISMFLHLTYDTLSLPGLFSILFVIVVAIADVHFLNKMAREALHDEYYWGMSKGYVPVSVSSIGDDPPPPPP